MKQILRSLSADKLDLLLLATRSVVENMHSTISIVSSLQATAIRVTCCKAFTVCSIYLPPSAKWNNSDITDLLYQLPSPVLLLGDFSAHSPLWGCIKLYSKGKMIEDIHLKHNWFNQASGTQQLQFSNICSSGHRIYLCY